MSNKDMRTIKSAHRVLEILEYFDRKHKTATVMDLSRALSYPQSSTSELLRCLTRLGYLHYDRYERTYSPTARVALLGAWVEPTLFRGGAVLTVLDRVANAIGETVVLSTAASYTVQHLHVIDGAHDAAVAEHAGRTESLLHSPVGKLLLATYKETHIRSAVHRLNAEEEDPARRVRLVEHMEELARLHAQGWIATPDHGDGTGSVAVLLPPRCGAERLVLSVRAASAIIVARTEEIIQTVQEQRKGVLPVMRPKPAMRPDAAPPSGSRPVPMAQWPMAGPPRRPVHA